ncbi:E3 ubiquitin-protein ligase DIS1-like [Coccinella septempunctata]|uniref:E3 ubiquitin-protein ligase DIS1-like n=1 Tax=Coccinella septempunctata TaxID=41139 RepID=UPI001D05E4C4|nr:E3 ubiquitin-protein ligase DIS1-like [Coccinella septempunctata]
MMTDSFCQGTPQMTFVSGSDKILNKKILDIIKCPKCAYFLRPPMFLCTEGHNYCEECFRRNSSRCPECGAVKTENRSVQLEQIHNALFFRCFFSRFGCRMICRGIIIRLHESQCSFRMYGNL